MKKIKIIAIVLGVVIVALLAVLIFIPTPTQPGLAVTLPHANDIVSSPLAIEGEVTGGGWFFEATFPIKILDADGAVLGEGTAQALSDWMSSGTVPFAASIPFKAPHFATGTIVFHNDNPSGLPQYDKVLNIPIKFR